jgi:quinol-cytochrome oxidoreductase complex cytochrome b subunit
MKIEQERSGWIARLHGVGGLLLLVLVVQAVSGVYLAMFYQPAPVDAWKSVAFIENKVALGGFFLALHRWGASVSALLLIIHVLCLIWSGAYRKPRESAWFSGILLVLLTAAFAVTGYLLPWDFRAYWAALTMENWLEHLPLFSGVLGWLLSAKTPGGVVPVARWFTLHAVLLPLLTGAALAWHFFAIRRNTQLRIFTAKSSMAAAGMLLLLGLLAAFGIQKLDAADPITTSPFPQPDWLFFMFFQVTRYLQDNLEMLGVFWIPAAVTLGLFLLPFIDRGEERSILLKWPLILSSLALCLALMIFTYHTGSTTPAWSCPACHKEDFGQAFSRPPETVDKYSKRYDNKWLALHYRYPQYFWMMDADVPGW